jgi:hypothetical protein
MLDAFRHFHRTTPNPQGTSWLPCGCWPTRPGKEGRTGRPQAPCRLPCAERRPSRGRRGFGCGVRLTPRAANRKACALSTSPRPFGARVELLGPCVMSAGAPRLRPFPLSAAPDRPKRCPCGAQTGQSIHSRGPTGSPANRLGGAGRGRVTWPTRRGGGGKHSSAAVRRAQSPGICACRTSGDE